MAAAALKLSGSVRINSLQLGTTKWKQGSFEIIEKDTKVNMLVRFSSTGIPKTYRLNQNVKNVILVPKQHLCRLQVILKESSILVIDKVPLVMAQKFKECLDKLKQGKHTALKPSQGSVSFGGVLGNKSIHKESSQQLPPIERLTPPRKVSLDSREEVSARKLLGSPSRRFSTPVRTRISENSLSCRIEKRKRLLTPGNEVNEDYPKENDSYSNNKATTDQARSRFLTNFKDKQLSLKQGEENRSPGAMPLQPSAFYSSRPASKDYSQGNFVSDRLTGVSQPPPSKRSLVSPSQSTPFKKVRPSHDYTGWNKPRLPSLTQPQPLLQGFSNLGNTCYMNAILQSLFCLQSFSNDLLKQGIPWKRVPQNALLRRFAHLLAKKDLHSPEDKKDLLKKVKSAISTTAERFSGYMQNDAHEFLSQCLDQLKEDVEKVNKSWKNEMQPREDIQVGWPSEDIPTSRIYTCPVVANMEFEVQHNIVCKACGETVTKREQFNDLSIDLPRRKQNLPLRSIQDSLDLFFRLEEIEYSCEKCNGKSATVNHKFSKLPRVLILHLKRYSFNAQLSLNSKLGQQVLIPKYISLFSHCTESTRPPLGLGWNAQTAMSRTLKTSQSLNSCTISSSTPVRKYKPQSPSVTILDSDSDEELTRKAVSHSRRLSEDDRTEKLPHSIQMEVSGFEGMNDEDVLAAVLEMSRQESALAGYPAPSEDEPTSSPDTGFGEDPFDTERPPQAVALAPDLDENKENQTPEEVQGELNWVQQNSLEHEREDQELQQALAQSLQEHEAREMKEDDDLKRATELSLQEFNTSLTECPFSDEDSGNEDVLDVEYSEAEADLKKNLESGELCNSYRIVSVVSHIGSSSSSGHYISDVYDMKKQSWLTYNDLDVSTTQESSVQRDRDRSGYIFFYMHKDVFEELLESEKIVQACGGKVCAAASLTYTERQNEHLWNGVLS
ncbi:ubiquitin carboxyl-terminal hydrolase 37 isoform X1 [Acipenser ruthenus]|uniref:ubiquitin carboxyl-terminal hydrolase 37 isoform X1 n=1 Tax=Acipenser ruthenus TaxID=7906 RepID=UPI0027403192|nr:ubiquitin carboxyl-terminal hydrolase 37 isoform X1 [Acipenser ruthenus]